MFTSISHCISASGNAILTGQSLGTRLVVDNGVLSHKDVLISSNDITVDRAKTDTLLYYLS